MKTYLQTTIFFLFLSMGIQLQAQNDVAIIGWDGVGGDEILFALLRDHAAGEVIYFTEEDYSDAGDAFGTGEGHLAYTVPAGGLTDGSVVSITESAANSYTVGCAGGSAVHVAGTGNWSFSAADEMYAYTATNPGSPWNTITQIHSFAWFQVVPIPVDQNPISDYPAVLITSFTIAGPGGMNAQLLDAVRPGVTVPQFQSGANWQQSTGDITFSCAPISMHVLPIDLMAFDAKLSRDEVKIDWATASEINNERFEVEHSTDGRNFTVIGTTEGQGDSYEVNKYNMVHAFPSYGLNYYRLKQVDYDGAFSYSDLKSVRYLDQKTKATAYPNPTTDGVTLSFPSLAYGDYLGKVRKIEVYDNYGRLAIRTEVPMDKNNVDLDLSGLQSGIYFLQTMDFNNSNVEKIRIVKM